MPRRKQLTTVPEVIKAIGENRALEIAGAKWPSAVRNWSWREKLPADTYLAFTEILNRQGLTAPAELWGMREAS